MPGAAEPQILETASQYVTADKPETTAAFPVSQEIVVESNPNLTPNPNPPPHTLVLRWIYMRKFRNLMLNSSRDKMITRTSQDSSKVIIPKTYLNN